MTTSTSHLTVPLTDTDFAAAKRQFVELYGSIAVMNTYLKIAVLVLVVADGGLVVQNARLASALRNTKPVVIRIDDVGRTEALGSTAAQYKPQAKEIRFFLTDFVQRHYGRMRATLRDNYARSLYFLDGRLADALMEANTKANSLEQFLAGSGDEIDINVTNVVIRDLREAPYKAEVDFEKVYYGANRTVTRRETFVANVVFILRDEVPNASIPVNPLGLTITYLREDQAFQ